MRDIARRPVVTKGEMSTELTRLLDPPVLRFCRPCNEVDTWSSIKGEQRKALMVEAERLAAHRGLALSAVRGV
jgi:hypothetical protein